MGGSAVGTKRRTEEPLPEVREGRRPRLTFTVSRLLSKGMNDLALDYAVGYYWKNRSVT